MAFFSKIAKFASKGIGSLFSGALGIGGQILSNRAERRNIEAVNIASAAEAAKNRAFQERLSSTSHQRDVKDLRAAGLNPILSTHAGASGASGSAAQMAKANISYGDLGASAMSARKTEMLNRQLIKQNISVARETENTQHHLGTKYMNEALKANYDNIANAKTARIYEDSDISDILAHMRALKNAGLTPTPANLAMIKAGQKYLKITR